MLHKWLTKRLPLPGALRVAVEEGNVAMTSAEDDTIAFVIRPTCPNRLNVLAAIEQWKRWQLSLAAAEGALVAAVGLALAAGLVAHSV